MTDYEQVCDFQNLYQAHLNARKGKRGKAEVIEFEMNLSENLWQLQKELLEGTYRISGYYRFMIKEPKEREIQALSYRDRVVQHSLCDNVLTPFFESRLIYDNAACRIGKGTHFALNRVTGFLQDYYKKYGARGWILKADVRKYFASVDHQVLLARLEKVIPDPKVMQLLRTIIESDTNCADKGLPIGNQTSQWFALYYLDPLDRLVKEKLRVKYYSRYMDDSVLIHPDKEFLQECRRQMEAKAKELGLKLNEKTKIFPIANGVDYLGWHFYLTDSGKVVKRLRTQNKKRLKRRLRGMQKRYAAGEIQGEDIRRSMASTRGYLQYGHTRYMQQKICRKAVFCRSPVKRKEESRGAT